MQITRQADYAVRAMLYLARQGGDQRSATSHIAKEMKIPPSFLAKIISQLSIAGLIHTSRGAHGGVTLLRSVEDISILEVLEAIDGPIALNECTLNPATCEFGSECPVHSLWCEVQSDLVERLRKTTFAQFINNHPKPIV